MERQLILTNGRILLPDGTIRAGYLICGGGKILEIGEATQPAGPWPNDYQERVDVAGRYIVPGFIDMHTHGAGGFDFMDATPEAFLGAARMHAKHGTTALLPTTLTSTDEALFHTFDVYNTVKPLNTQGATFLGLHLEGPYFAFNQRGAQDPRFLRKPSPDDYMKILDATDDIVRWSLAPELEGALAFGRVLRSRNILPSIAHTDAIYEEAVEAYSAGFSHVTHLYSCMSTVTRRNAYRYAGVIEAAYMLDGMTVEIIADGVHLPKSLLQLVYKLKGPDKIALVTDSMRAAGMPDGPSILGGIDGGQAVIVEEGVATLPDRTAFAGSVATADRLVRTLVEVAEVPLPEAVRMITATPARILGIADRKGALAVGMDADLVVMDAGIRVKCTVIGGKIVYNTLIE